MDRRYPLFAKKKSVDQLVLHGIQKNGMPNSPEEIRELFHIDRVRFQRPLTGVGNERFKAMAAIGYVHQKQVFCFPWFSRRRFDSFHGHMTDVLNVLESLGKIVVLPLGRE